MTELYYEIQTLNLFLQSKAGKVYHACKVVCLVLMLQNIQTHSSEDWLWTDSSCWWRDSCLKWFTKTKVSFWHSSLLEFLIANSISTHLLTITIYCVSLSSQLWFQNIRLHSGRFSWQFVEMQDNSSPILTRVQHSYSFGTNKYMTKKS